MTEVIARDDCVAVPRAILTRLEVEDFIYREAALLDAWALDEWFALFADPCSYEVTPPGIPDPEGASRNEVYFIIGDDHLRLSHRVLRMNTASAHVEQPRSKTRHVYSNVIVESEADGVVTAALSFITFRTKRGTVEYFGKIRFVLERAKDGFRIRSKRAILDVDALIPQGKVSIFL